MKPCARDQKRTLWVQTSPHDSRLPAPPTLVLRLPPGDVHATRHLSCLACRFAGICPGACIDIRARKSTPHEKPIHIYYATETGNCETLARQSCEHAQAQGWDAQIRNLADYHPGDLIFNGPSLFIVSTWGEGEPPSAAVDFFNELNQSHAPSLAGLQHAVVGLGVSSYTQFNAFARQFDVRLEELGSQRFLERLECDLDYEDHFPA